MTKKQFTIEEIIEWIDKNVKYEYYPDDKFIKRNKDLFDHKPLNCSDRMREMTEKRFTCDTGNLFDNKMNTFYQIEDSDENIKLFCDNLNNLVEENERLREERQLLYENIDFFKRFIEKQGFKVKLDDKLFRVI